MPLTKAEHIQIRQGLGLMVGFNLNGEYHVSRTHVEALLDKYTEDLVNSLEGEEPAEFERE